MRLLAPIHRSGQDARTIEDPEKLACDELARTLLARGAPSGARLLEELGLLGVPYNAELNGVTRPELEARIARVGPKSSLLPLRVCFLGESTAAGWLYAPEVTPARMLQAELARACGPRVFEVIDLSAIDVTPAELVAIAEQSLELVPDLIVVFAGNNWPVRLPLVYDASPADSRLLAARWSQSGFAGLARVIAETTRRLGERVLLKLAELSERASALMILVVPEVNLFDWQRSRPVAWLPGDGVNTWHALAARARSCLTTGDFVAAAAAARQMIELDAGLNPTSHRLLAIALSGLGELEACRAACIAEVETRIFDNYPTMPGITREIQDLIRRGAKQHELSLVDLPELFAGALGRAPAGREFFLDYCHLTAEGMVCAMKKLASAVLSVADPETSRTIDSEKPALEVPRELDARAKFLSGLCTAHWSARESPSLAPYWFDAALRSWPEIATEMLSFVAGRTVHAELMQFSKAEQELDALSEAAGRRLRHAFNVDAEVVEWLLDAIERMGRDAGRAELNRRLIEVHGVNPSGINLAAAVYHHHSFLQLSTSYSALGPEPALYLRSLWPRFEHTLIADAEQDVELELTARLPPEDGPREAPLGLELNGRPLCSVVLFERWTKHAVRIDRRLLRHGVNRLTLVWPAVSTEGERALARVAERWSEGVPADHHPTFGELLALVARALEKS